MFCQFLLDIIVPPPPLLKPAIFISHKEVKDQLLKTRDLLQIFWQFFFKHFKILFF